MCALSLGQGEGRREGLELALLFSSLKVDRGHLKGKWYGEVWTLEAEFLEMYFLFQIF